MFTSLRKILQNSNVSAMVEFTQNYGLDYLQTEYMKKRAAELPTQGFSAAELYSELYLNHGFPYAGENSDSVIGSRNSRQGN